MNDNAKYEVKTILQRVETGASRIILAALIIIMFLPFTGVSCEEGTVNPTTDTAGKTENDVFSESNSAGGLQAIGEKIGITVGDNLSMLDDKQLDDALADIASLGVTWLRFDMSWSAAQRDGPDSYDWARFDRIVAAANKNNLKMLPILAFTPRWARQPECADSMKCAPSDTARFASFAMEAVKRYEPMGIKTWEIWNEPNIDAFWKPVPDAAAYTELLKASYTGIKQVDPEAIVISGGLSPAGNVEGRIAPLDYLVSMYQNGAKDYFDALGYHPFSYPALPSDVISWSNWSQLADLYPSVRSIMMDYGDGDKQVWGTEFGVPTGGPRKDVDESLQALMFTDAIEQMRDKPWLATLFFHTYKDLSDDPSTLDNFFGIVRHDGTKKPAYYELKEILASE